jgi:hypothetical protein
MTSHHPTKFTIIGAQVSTPNWTGAPLTLAWHDNAAMPSTPAGSTVLGWANTATMNNDGTLALTSAGAPQFLDAPAGTLIPSILVKNYKANSLTLTNLSANKATPIWVEMFGPGLPGPTPTPITAGAAPISLAAGGTASGSAPPNYAQLILTSNTNNLTIVTLIGGPADSSGNNAYVFALNYMGPPNPAGYTQATAGNSITYQFYWTSTFFAANMSQSNSAAVQVSLISL